MHTALCLNPPTIPPHFPLTSPFPPPCSLLETTCSVVKAAAYDVARAFGRYCAQAFVSKGYARLLVQLGHSFVDFMRCLNRCGKMCG